MNNAMGRQIRCIMIICMADVIHKYTLLCMYSKLLFFDNSMTGDNEDEEAGTRVARLKNHATIKYNFI